MIESTHIVKTSASLILALLCLKQNSTASNISLQVVGPPSNDRSSLKYNLYTRENPEQPCILEETRSSLKECPLDPNLETIIIMSGWKDKLRPEGLIFAMKDRILKVGEYNVIILDWTKYSVSTFLQATFSVNNVGTEVAEMITFLKKNAGVDAQKFHLIGMSIGSHLAGNVGRKVPNLGRITDLQFGLSKPVGHMDFYINGGIRQPQCVYGANFRGSDGNTEKDTDLSKDRECNHVVAVSYFLETINSTDCHFIGTLCKSYDDFKKGTCDAKNTVVAEMGFQGRQLLGLPPNSKFYLRTNLNSPYCLMDGYVPGKFPHKLSLESSYEYSSGLSSVPSTESSSELFYDPSSNSSSELS